MDRIQCYAGARRSWVTLPRVCLVCGQKRDWSGLRSRRDRESGKHKCQVFFPFVLRVHLLGCHLHFFFFFFFKNLVKSIHLFEENQT